MRIWAGLLRDLSLAEHVAAKHYADTGYRNMNSYLRYGELVEPDKAITQTEQVSRVTEQIDLLNGMLRRQPLPETIDVFRAVSHHPDLFPVPIQELPGTVQRDPGFFSTSIGDRPMLSGPIILHLRVPAGTPAFYLQLLSRDPTEKELLLGSGVSYFVEDVRREDGKWLVYGWVLPPDKSGG